MQWLNMLKLKKNNNNNNPIKATVFLFLSLLIKASFF